MDRGYGPTRRVTRRNDIARLFDQGRRVGDGILTLFVVPNGLPHCRAGVAVSGRHGNAVRRNRAKRLCREAFRLSQDRLSGGWDGILIPRPGVALTLPKLQDSLVRLWARAVAAGKGER